MRPAGAVPVLLAIAAHQLGSAAAQHHHHHGHDPFAGSGCNCSAFCAGECAINATGKAEITQYRMTQFGVVDMTNKNTGDVEGDTSFVISRRTSAYECRVNPSNFMCSGIAQFSGDVSNSTDLVLEWKLDINGDWGPYLMCNPLDAKMSTGGWACLDGLSHGMGTMPAPPGDYPASCAAGYKGADNFCLEGFGGGSRPTADLAACCAAAQGSGSEAYTYHANGTCDLSRFAWHGALCQGAVSGLKPPPPPPPPGTPGATCACKRVNMTVGREDLETSGMSGMAPAGGTWFSYPAMGECKAGRAVGDGSGCSWSAKAISKAINATCLYRHIDANIEATGKACFSACAPDPTGMSDCYLKCYSETVESMTHDALSAPWAKAFASAEPAAGGCPVVAQICDKGSARVGCPPAARAYELRAGAAGAR